MQIFSVIRIDKTNLSEYELVKKCNFLYFVIDKIFGFRTTFFKSSRKFYEVSFKKNY